MTILGLVFMILFYVVRAFSSLFVMCDACDDLLIQARLGLFLW